MPRILVLQGPNMNRLGKRPREHYGSQTLADLTAAIDAHAGKLGLTVEHVASNTEGTLVDWLQDRQDDSHGVIVNPAGLTFYGDSLRQALLESELPVAVVHLSNIFAREDITSKPWRAHDVFAGVAAVYLAGLGARGYLAALESLAEHLR